MFKLQISALTSATTPLALVAQRKSLLSSPATGHGIEVPFIPVLQKCDHGSANANGAQKTLLIIKSLSPVRPTTGTYIQALSTQILNLERYPWESHRLPIPTYTLCNSLPSETSTSSTGEKKAEPHS